MRVAPIALGLWLAACSKPDAKPPPEGDPPAQKIRVPTSGRGGEATPEPRPLDPPLAPDEAALEVTAPPRTPIGVAATARIRVRPAEGFHINTRYPFVVSLATTDGVTIGKSPLRGGRGGVPGDAETLADHELSIPITLTPVTVGDHVLNGSIQLGICKRDMCLTREAPIVVHVTSCEAASTGRC